MRSGRASEADDFALALTLALALGVGLKFVDFAYDDAYITYRYARNIVEGHGFVYNLEHNYLGTTTPLYTLILAALGFWMEIPLASGLLSLVSLLGCILCLEAIGRGEGIRFVGPLSGVFLLLSPELYRIFGGESLFAQLGLLPLGLLLQQRGRTRLAACVFGLAMLARMDSAVFVALVYARALYTGRRLPWPEILVLAATLAPWFVYAQLVFGHPLPSTLWAKIAQGESGGWPLFLEGSTRYLGELVEYRGSLRPLFLLLGLAGLVRLILVERALLIFIANSALLALAYQYVLRASFSHWYLAHAYLGNAILLGAGLRALFALPAAAASGRGPLRAAVGVGTALLAAAYLSASTRALLRFDVYPPRRQIYSEVGRWLAEHTAPHDSIAYFEIGYLGWFSRRTVIDPVGLVTPGGLDHIRGGDLAWVFDRYRPDYYLHNPHLGRAGLLDQPWFRTRYKPLRRFEQKGFRGGLVLYRKL